MRRTDEYAGALEIQILSKLYSLNIAIFLKSKSKYRLTDCYKCVRQSGIRVKFIPLFFENSHYEPLNIPVLAVKLKIISQLKLLDQEGVSDRFFLHNKRFDSLKDYKNHEIALFSSTIQPHNIDSNSKFEGELIEDFKFKQIILLASQSNSDAVSLLSSPSEGVKTRRKRRSKEVEKAITDEFSQLHSKKV